VLVADHDPAGDCSQLRPMIETALQELDDARLDPDWAEIGPSVLVRVVILYMYFSDFAALLASGLESDPIADFFDYRTVRDALRARNIDDDARELLTDFGVLSPGDSAVDYTALREELNQEVPSCFSALARNGEFLAVLDGLRDEDVRARLIRKLEGAEFIVPELPAEPAPRGGAEPVPRATGADPYRLRLEEVVSATDFSKIAARDELVFHAMGDTGSPKNPNPQIAVAAALAVETPVAAFLYLLGDLVYFYGERDCYYSQFYEPYAKYPGPIFAIPGNHDGSRGDESSEPSLAAFVDNFCAAKPEHRPEAGDVARNAMIQPHVHWTLEAPLVTIIGLYTNVPAGGFVGDDQVDWLVSELGQASADRALVLAMHQPCYSADAHHGGSQRMET
jgi:Calcineurin-like phosphoesterase